jgi:hypothetical protein
MPRDPQSPRSGTETRQRRENESSTRTDGSGVSRRSCLKLAGSAAVVAAGAATTAAGESYDTITVPSNTKKNIYVDSGEVWENKLIDITASGASVQIIPQGNDWTVRDVGIKGVHPGGHYVLTPYVSDHDSTGVVENVYAGDGQVERTGKGFCWVQYDHRGTIEFRNVNVQHFVDNGLYTTSPGDEQDHTHGRSHMYDSYFYSNNISNCRTGAREDTNGMSHDHVCHVDGCTIVVDSTVPPCEEGCSSPGAQNSRAVWAVNGAVEVSDCDVQVDTSYGAYFETLHGGYYENDPWADNRTGADADTSIPDCVPTSPEDAADGSDCDGGGGGGGGDTTEVAEDFSHNDVPGTYSLDTGAFTTTSTRSTSDSYALRADDSADDDKLVLRDDMVTSAGNTYELDVYFPSDTDMGFLFGAQSATGYSDYTGYSGFFESDADEIRINYRENGSLTSQSATATTWPLDEWLTVELDYRDTDSSTITMTVFDAAGAEVASVSLADTTYDSGTIGWYNWYASADWHADSWFDAGGGDGGSGTVIDGFEDGDLSEYDFDRGSSAASVVTSPTQGGSYALEYVDTNVEAISTSGLDAYPQAGDTFEFWVRGSGGTEKTNLTYGVQDHANRYFVRVNVANDNFKLYKWEGDSTPGPLGSQTSGFTLSQDAWYRVEVQWGTGGSHTATLSDASGTQLAQISGSDSTWTSGGVGYDAYMDSGQAAYFDEVRLLDDDGDSSTTVVDDFEDGDLSEYGFDRGSSGASVVSSPTHSGSYALEYTGTNVEAISTSGLNAYPAAGDTFSFHVRGSGGTEKTNLTYGVQDHANRYFVRVNVADDNFKLYKWESNSTPGPLGSQTSGFTLSQDAWYRVEVQWSTDGTHTVTLLDASGNQLAQISGSDSTWTSGGVGYDAYLGSGESAYFDDVQIK